jgi:hypothetical protein
MAKMRTHGAIVLGLAILAGAALAAPAAAHNHDWTPWMGRPATERKHFQGNQFDRAGNPECVSPLAKPAESPHEVGYYVGGGAPVKSHYGEPRREGEGTWGMDYTGIIIPKKNVLNWWHGSRYQGGKGAYEADGPRILHKP